MGFKRVEKNRRSPDAISPEGTGQSVARHGSAGKHFKQIESRRDDTMGSSHAHSSAPAIAHPTDNKPPVQVLLRGWIGLCSAKCLANGLFGKLPSRPPLREITENPDFSGVVGEADLDFIYRRSE